MQKLDIEFAWPVASAGYDIREMRHPYGESGPALYLVARSDEQRWHNPVAFHPALFRQFADLPETPEAFAEFASKFGLLWGPLPRMTMTARDPDRAPIYGVIQGTELHHLDSVERWLAHVRRLRRLVREWDRARDKGETPRVGYSDLLPLPTLYVDLVDRAGRLGLCLRPNCLLSAINLQFYEAVTGTTEVRACAHCGTWFECGPGGRRRSASRFCSDTCRFNFHNARKGKGGAR